MDALTPRRLKLYTRENPAANLTSKNIPSLEVGGDWGRPCSHGFIILSLSWIITANIYKSFLQARHSSVYLTYIVTESSEQPYELTNITNSMFEMETLNQKMFSATFSTSHS